MSFKGDFLIHLTWLAWLKFVDGIYYNKFHYSKNNIKFDFCFNHDRKFYIFSVVMLRKRKFIIIFFLLIIIHFVCRHAKNVI